MKEACLSLVAAILFAIVASFLAILASHFSQFALITFTEDLLILLLLKNKKRKIIILIIMSSSSTNSTLSIEEVVANLTHDMDVFWLLFGSVLVFFMQTGEEY